LIDINVYATITFIFIYLMMALQIAKRGVGVATMLDQANLNCALTHLKMYATVTLIFIFLMRALHIASLRGLATVLGQVIFN
jgi:hypothetical protein